MSSYRVLRLNTNIQKVTVYLSINIKGDIIHQRFDLNLSHLKTVTDSSRYISQTSLHITTFVTESYRAVHVLTKMLQIYYLYYLYTLKIMVPSIFMEKKCLYLPRYFFLYLIIFYLFYLHS